MDETGYITTGDQGPTPNPQRPSRLRGVLRGMWSALSLIAVAANMLLFVVIFGAILLAGWGYGGLQEHLIQAGPQKDKIVIIPINGIIDARQSERFCQQIRAAAKDKSVKGLIIRINSPGGTISGSDQIYDQIRRFRRECDRPVVAFMEGVAASGGYYTAVACQQIIAEPTAITGSIGVILGHFVFGELFEKKLGIKPVILKSGPKKDWPSSFEPPTSEQLDYLRDRLLEPAYQRFVDVVREGRGDIISDQRLQDLADGSIFTAPQAKENGLIDRVGYLEDAIELIKDVAGLDRARVVEYRQPLSLVGLLTQAVAGRLNLDMSSLFELLIPQALYLWSY